MPEMADVDLGGDGRGACLGKDVALIIDGQSELHKRTFEARAGQHQP
jgi:hypothetical protein